MIISGTIKNSVNLAALDNKWQQKKQNFAKKEYQNMTAEERQLQHFKEQADEIREGRKKADIDAKLQSGGKLTPEEIEYLKRTDPAALKEYEEIQKERESYKKQLKNCKSKEEVEKLKTIKMGQFMAEAKEVTNNPHIPKGKKCQLMKKMLSRIYAVEEEHEKFVQSAKYAELPEEEKEARRRRHSDDVQQQEESSDVESPDISLDEEESGALEEIKKMASALIQSESSDTSGSSAKQDKTADVMDGTAQSIDLRL